MSLAQALCAFTLSAALLAGCASDPRTPFTESEQMTAVAIGAPQIRYWADATASARQSAARPAIVQKGRPFVYLALSGGGGGGAFGAGVLNGWSASGTRPEFTIVSGVSTGALIAPFAFLGPDYDDMLRQIYTNGEAQRLIGQSNPLGALFGSGVLGPERLRRLVGRYVDDDLIRAIAREDRKGRRLLVVTTNLDAQRAVVWDMGAIAASGEPKAFALFRDVLAASASIPVVFAPQLINVEADGKAFQEMHADGTLSAPVYTLPQAVLFGGKPLPSAVHPALYVIVNARIDPGFTVVPDQTEAIAAQSLSTLNRVGAKAVLAETYNATSREGMSFHLIYIDRDHPDSGGTGFETDAMRKLYDYGYEKARGGAFWVTDLSQVEAAKDAGKAAMAPIIR